MKFNFKVSDGIDHRHVIDVDLPDIYLDDIEGVVEQLPQLVQLMEAIRKMRQLQKQYFKTRDHDILLKSKEAEKVVDRLTDRQQELGL